MGRETISTDRNAPEDRLATGVIYAVSASEALRGAQSDRERSYCRGMKLAAACLALLANPHAILSQ
jgi:hypothetical protein